MIDAQIQNYLIAAPSKPKLARHSQAVSCEVTPAEADSCRLYPPSLTLRVHLRQHHAGPVCAIVPESIAQQLRMSPNTARKARDFLLRAKLIEPCTASLLPRASRPGRKPTLYIVQPFKEPV